VYDSDYGEEIPRLEPFARGLYYVRNRWLDPEHGRWTTRDPNATVQVVVMQPAMHGSVCKIVLLEWQHQTHFDDGLHAAGYLDGSPLIAHDPMGLFSLVETMGASTNSVDLQGDWSQEIGEFGLNLKDAAMRTFDAAGIYQIADAEWASDWGASDDDYSQSGVIYDAALSDESRGIGGSWHPMAAVYDTPAAVRAAAAASRHGSPAHYRAMAEQVIEMAKRNGWRLKDLDIEFNKAFKNSRGRALHIPGYGKARPDFIIKKGGKIVGYGEIAVSQSLKNATARVNAFKKYIATAATNRRAFKVH
jgi:hypothetical protein